MEKMVLKIFQREVERQCKFAIIAVEQIKAGLANNDSDLVWYALQNLLVAIGNISKIFWPINRKYRKRGEELRRSGLRNNNSII